VTTARPARPRRCLRATASDAARERLIRQLAEAEAQELEAEWARSGWTVRVIARALRIATGLLMVFGSGPYRIVLLPAARGRRL
jgi:hypothetical protein